MNSMMGGGVSVSCVCASVRQWMGFYMQVCERMLACARIGLCDSFDTVCEANGFGVAGFVLGIRVKGLWVRG